MAISYAIKREEIFLGKRLHHGEPAGKQFVRLSSDKNAKWVRPVHETWQVNEPVEVLSTPLEHYSAKSVSSFIRKIDYYSTINAGYLESRNAPVSWWHILAYPAGKFISNYIVKRGFLDGTHGFLHAAFMSFHSFLTRGKLWILYSKK